MEILLLILYNASNEYNTMREIQRAYLNSSSPLVPPKINYFFYCFSPTIDKPFVFDGDMLYIKGNETYVPGILNKTLLAIDICLKKFPHVTYILRTNISTLCNLKLLTARLRQQPVQYAGPKVYTLNTIDVRGGIVDQRWFGYKFVHGTGIVMSRRVCELLTARNAQVDKSLIDDVSIGVFLNRHGISPHSFEDEGFCYKINDPTYGPNTIFYRNRHFHDQAREHDLSNMTKIAKQFVRYPLQFAFYGKMEKKDNKPRTKTKAKNMNKNVNKIVYQMFLQPDKKFLVIPQSVNFQKVFGDVPGLSLENQTKILYVKFCDRPKVFYIREDRNTDVVLKTH